MIARGRLSTTRLIPVFGVLWTVFVFLIAVAALRRGTGTTVVWWAVFPAGWILASKAPSAAVHRRAVLVGWILLGSALVCVGAWMAWPWYSPRYTGMRILLPEPPLARRGYQLVDLPLLGLAVGGSAAAVRCRNFRGLSDIALDIGFGTFVLAVGLSWFVGDGLWVFSWGYNTTLGGSVGLVYAGLFGRTALDDGG